MFDSEQNDSILVDFDNYSAICKESIMPSGAVSAKKSAVIHQHALSNVQMELVKLYSTNLNDDELLELKNILVDATEQPVERPQKNSGISTAAKRNVIPRKRR